MLFLLSTQFVAGAGFDLNYKAGKSEVMIYFRSALEGAGRQGPGSTVAKTALYAEGGAKIHFTNSAGTNKVLLPAPGYKNLGSTFYQWISASRGDGQDGCNERWL